MKTRLGLGVHNIFRQTHMAGDLQWLILAPGSCLAAPPETIAPAFHSQDSAEKGRQRSTESSDSKMEATHRDT